MVNSVHDDLRTDVAALDGLFALAPKLADAMQRGLAERGLTLAGAQVIWMLDTHGPLVQRALSELLGVTPRYVTRLVDALEEQRLIARQPHPSDRRATLVTLTERGRKLAAEMDRGRRELAHQLFGDARAAELAGFVTVLHRVLARLAQVDSPEPANP